MDLESLYFICGQVFKYIYALFTKYCYSGPNLCDKNKIHLNKIICAIL